MKPEIDIEKIAHLARLTLTSDEATRFKRDLETVIELAEGLSKLPEIPEAAELGGAFREDAPGECLSRDELLSNAHETSDGCFSVPQAVQGA